MSGMIVIVSIGKGSHRAVGTTTIDVVQNGRRATDTYSSITLHQSSLNIFLLTFTTTIDVAILSSALAGCADGAAIDGHYRIAIHARFLTTAIDAFANGCCTLNFQGRIASYNSQSRKVCIGIYIIFAIFSNHTSSSVAEIRGGNLFPFILLCGIYLTRLEHTDIHIL